MVTRGEVYWCVLDPAVGGEIRKTRPCVVVQRDWNRQLLTRIVCPLSGANDRPGTLVNPLVPAGVAGLSKASRVMCHQPRALDQSRIGRLIGVLPPEIMVLVDQGLREILDLA